VKKQDFGYHAKVIAQLHASQKEAKLTSCKNVLKNNAKLG